MRNKPLPGMMKHSPMKQTKGPVIPKNHPVIPPTEEQSKKDKGTLSLSEEYRTKGSPYKPNEPNPYDSRDLRHARWEKAFGK